MSSYSGDVYPNTPSFTFRKATYKSKYVAFKSDEQYANYIDPKTNYYAALQKPTSQEIALVTKYDTPKYIKGLPANPPDPIPFMTFANRYLVAGASYSPALLAGTTRTEIAAALNNPASPITEAIIASANYQTAAICALTKDQPSNVCSSSAVKAAEKVMNKS